MGFWKWLDMHMRESNENSRERAAEWERYAEENRRREREEEEKRQQQLEEEKKKSRCCANCRWYNYGCTNSWNNGKDESDYIEYKKTHETSDGRRVALYSSEKVCREFEYADD